MNRNNIKKVRMERLGFANPFAGESEYDELFKRLQPVSTEYFCEPGRPPSIRNRAIFNDVEYNRLTRQNQEIIKARFQGSTISYVLRDELELYAAAFAKPIRKIDETAMELYTILCRMGPLDKKQLMEEMDLKGPAVTKILQKFQKAFMVYELQPDTFGEQVWQAFEAEWPEFNINSISVKEARRQVVLRFIRNMVVTDFDMVKDWTRFSKSDTKDIISDLLEEALIIGVDIDKEALYFCPGDKAVIFNKIMVGVTPSVFVVHKSDYLYRAYESKLKERYKGKEILQFLLIDGEFGGAVEGHWRIGPHNVENIIVELPKEEAALRKGEIIAKTGELYHPPFSNILKYNGQPV